MKLNFFACGRYRKLRYASRDRDLTAREHRFVDKHEISCPTCAPAMEFADDALDILRSTQLEPLMTHNFEERVIRRHKVESVRARVRYWSPAMVGAVVAGVVVLAAMQMIAQSSNLPMFKVPGGEARLSSPAIPNLDSQSLNNWHESGDIETR